MAARKVLLLGFGAIGRHICKLLEPECKAGTAELTAAVRSLPQQRTHGPRFLKIPPEGFSTDFLAPFDVVLECAGVTAAQQYGPSVINNGKDLLLTSVGALADETTRLKLLSKPGKLHVSHGAIGGFDVLGSAADANGLNSVTIKTNKLPTSLIRPWMSEGERGTLMKMGSHAEPITVFEGKPAQAINQFPENINVAVALAWAIKGRSVAAGVEPVPFEEAHRMAEALERIKVELIADPQAATNRHQITATGSAGRFYLQFESAPSPQNPKTSGMTALAVAHSLRALIER